MNIWSILIGLIIGVFPILFILRFIRGKFLFFTNPYIKGALFGFLLWGLINLFLYFEVRYNIFGLSGTEEGFSTIVVLTSSLQGFLTAGLVAAFISTRMDRKKAAKP